MALEFFTWIKYYWDANWNVSYGYIKNTARWDPEWDQQNPQQPIYSHYKIIAGQNTNIFTVFPK